MQLDIPALLVKFEVLYHSMYQSGFTVIFGYSSGNLKDFNSLP